MRRGGKKTESHVLLRVITTITKSFRNLGLSCSGNPWGVFLSIHFFAAPPQGPPSQKQLRSGNCLFFRVGR